MTRPAEHWLWRLEASDWLAAAQRELELARNHLDSRRKAVTHARRAAGMGLNGVLVAMADRGWPDQKCETQWGRSYIDHIRHLANDEPERPVTDDMLQAASVLAEIAVMPDASLVQLGASPNSPATEALDAATKLLKACARACATG